MHSHTAAPEVTHAALNDNDNHNAYTALTTAALAADLVGFLSLSPTERL